jgi:hypothetical protein
MADLIGVRAKFNHAKKYLETFDRSLLDFLSRIPYSLTLDFDENTKGYRSVWRVHEQPPVELSLINGDIFSNLRASLDYLVWQLVLANGKKPTRMNAFPCLQANQDWADVANRCLRDIDRHWVDEIERLQPNYQGDHPELHALALLDSFNNFNKHRFMPPVVTAVVETQFQIAGGRDYVLKGETFLDQPIEDGTEFMAIRCEPPGPISDLQITLKGQSIFRISFSDESNSKWEMAEIFEWVEKAIDVFETAFPNT